MAKFLPSVINYQLSTAR